MSQILRSLGPSSVLPPVSLRSGEDAGAQELEAFMVAE